MEDFESRLNTAIERNAFLESELDEKESLKASVQRMKDETRDLKSELRLLAPKHPNLSSLESSVSIDLPDNDRYVSFPIRDDFFAVNLFLEVRIVLLHSPIAKLRPANFTFPSHALNNNSKPDSNKLAEEQQSKAPTTKGSPKTSLASVSSSSNNGTQQQPLAPSARISALNIVGDLLRKVGALELKLVSCRNIVKENGATSSSSTPSASTAPRNAAPNSPEGRRGSSSSNGDALMDRSKRIPRGQSTPMLKKIVDSPL